MTSPLFEELQLPGGADPASLAHDMIEVHGSEAVTIARDNARTAALAAQLLQAKSWLKVVDLIQRRQAGKPAPQRGADRPAVTPPTES